MVNQVKADEADQQAIFTLDLAAAENFNFQDSEIISVLDQTFNQIKAEEIARSTIDLAIDSIKMEWEENCRAESPMPQKERFA